MNNSPASIGQLWQTPAFELSFRLREPVAGTPKGCVVLLHGVGGSETDLATLAAGIDPAMLVVLPRGPLPLGSNQFAWFRVAFTTSGPVIEADEAEQSRQSLIRFIAQLQQTYQLEPHRTVIAGFSQGGILSASVALSVPECVAGFGVLSGRILPELEPRIASKERLGNLKGFIGHGEFDSKLPVAWAHRSETLLSELGVNHQLRIYPIDHGISTDMDSDFRAWIATLA